MFSRILDEMPHHKNTSERPRLLLDLPVRWTGGELGTRKRTIVIAFYLYLLVLRLTECFS